MGVKRTKGTLKVACAYRRVLQPIYEFTERSQGNDLTLSDFRNLNRRALGLSAHKVTASQPKSRHKQHQNTARNPQHVSIGFNNQAALVGHGHTAVWRAAVRWYIPQLVVNKIWIRHVFGGAVKQVAPRRQQLGLEIFVEHILFSKGRCRRRCYCFHNGLVLFLGWLHN